jgi:hypothetical protein
MHVTMYDAMFGVGFLVSCGLVMDWLAVSVAYVGLRMRTEQDEESFVH